MPGITERTGLSEHKFQFSDGRQVVLELYHDGNDRTKWFRYYDVLIEGRTVESEKIAQHAGWGNIWNERHIEQAVRQKYEIA